MSGNCLAQYRRLYTNTVMMLYPVSFEAILPYIFKTLVYDIDTMIFHVITVTKEKTCLGIET